MNLPETLEYLMIIDGYKEYEQISKKEKTLSINIPKNVKTFITSDFIDFHYKIIKANDDTKIAIFPFNHISKRIENILPEKYKEFFRKTINYYIRFT